MPGDEHDLPAAKSDSCQEATSCAAAARWTAPMTFHPRDSSGPRGKQLARAAELERATVTGDVRPPVLPRRCSRISVGTHDARSAAGDVSHLSAGAISTIRCALIRIDGPYRTEERRRARLRLLRERGLACLRCGFISTVASAPVRHDELSCRSPTRKKGTSRVIRSTFEGRRNRRVRRRGACLHRRCIPGTPVSTGGVPGPRTAARRLHRPT